MKITFILPGYSRRPVGGFRVVYEYANHLVARGHKVAVVHPRRLSNWNPPPPNLYHWLRRKAGHLRNIILRPKVGWQPIDHRVQMLYVPEPTARYVPNADIVFATAWQTGEIVVEYSAEKGRKFYLIQHYEVWGGPKERVDATWRAPFKKIVIARWLYEKGLELGVSASEMVHIPNGINHAFFRLLEPIEKRLLRVAMMYSSVDWKGGADGVKAIELAKHKFPRLKAVLFGVEPRPRWLPSWIEYVQNPPQQVLVEQIYNRSILYLCPSWTEGWGLPPAEAMACGCAVVSTDNDGIRDFAEQEKTALLSPPRDPEALGKNLLRLLENDNLRIQLAKAGHERIKEFTWERSTNLLEQFLLQHVEV
ncbi:MAG: Phosphatidyl-myo-inositol mannosyltransferase [Dehalococcoidia bacterium]|nr:Phosphatidyl-myo-inositol mannosyltransferase [Bacillota bacterium]